MTLTLTYIVKVMTLNNIPKILAIGRCSLKVINKRTYKNWLIYWSTYVNRECAHTHTHTHTHRKKSTGGLWPPTRTPPRLVELVSRGMLQAWTHSTRSEFHSSREGTGGGPKAPCTSPSVWVRARVLSTYILWY